MRRRVLAAPVMDSKSSAAVIVDSPGVMVLPALALSPPGSIQDSPGAGPGVGAFIDDQRPVDQYVFHALGILVWVRERCPVDDVVWIEDGDIGDEPFAEKSSVLKAEPVGGGPAHLADGLFKGQDSSFAYIAPEHACKSAVLAGMRNAFAQYRNSSV